MHAPASKHPFLDQIKTPSAKALARRRRDAAIEINTAKQIENALNAMGEIPSVGEMLFTVKVTAENIQVSAGLKEPKRIITG